MIKKTLLVLVAGAMALAACGGDDSTASSTTTTAAGPSKAELTALLLTPADLGTGDALDAKWATGDVSDGVDITLPKCVDEDQFDGSSTVVAKLVTDNPLKLPALEEHLTAYADRAAADASLKAAATRLDGCAPEFIFQGTTSKGTIARLEVPSLGDATEAWRTTVEIAQTQVAITNVYTRVGNDVVSFVHVDAGNPDVTAITALFQKGVDKLA